MMFIRDYVQEMILKICNTQSFDEALFAKTVIDAIRFEDLQAGFSEYETYGNFLAKYHPLSYTSEKQNSIRHGTEYFGRAPNISQLFALSTKYKWASFESWDYKKEIPTWKRFAKRVLGQIWTFTACLFNINKYKTFKARYTK